MEIRKAAKKDINVIAKLMLTEFSKPPFNERDSLSAVLKSLEFYYKIGNIYIAADKTKTAGIVVFKIEQYWEGPVIIIEDLAVKETFKKQGVGSMLLRWVESYAKKNKIKMISFRTNKKSPALKFYKKHGYKQKADVVYFEKKMK